jgi:biotin carboxyl carrier protein
MSVKVIVDGRPTELILTQRGDSWTIRANDSSLEAQVVEVEPGVWSVLVGSHSLEVQVAGTEYHVRGREFNVHVADPRDLATSSGSGNAQGRQALTSSMPGKVVRILVREGEPVERNQGIVVIEAMKMQNEMKSSVAGIVQKIEVVEGDTVPAGKVLAVVE